MMDRALMWLISLFTGGSNRCDRCRRLVPQSEWVVWRRGLKTFECLRCFESARD